MPKILDEALIGYVYKSPLTKTLLKELELEGKTIKEVLTSSDGDLYGILEELVGSVCLPSLLKDETLPVLSLSRNRGGPTSLKEVGNKQQLNIKQTLLFEYEMGNTFYDDIYGGGVNNNAQWLRYNIYLKVHLESDLIAGGVHYHYIRHDNGDLKYVEVRENSDFIISHDNPTVRPSRDNPPNHYLDHEGRLIKYSMLGDAPLYPHIYEKDVMGNVLLYRNSDGEQFSCEYELNRLVRVRAIDNGEAILAPIDALNTFTNVSDNYVELDYVNDKLTQINHSDGVVVMVDRSSPYRITVRYDNEAILVVTK